MNKRITSGVIAGIAAICVAVPAAGLADQGGHPHSKKACKTHRHYGRHEGFTKGHGKHKGFGRGKKCGFSNPVSTGTTSTTNETGPTGSTGTTGTTGTHHSRGHRH